MSFLKHKIYSNQEKAETVEPEGIWGDPNQYLKVDNWDDKVFNHHRLERVKAGDEEKLERQQKKAESLRKKEQEYWEGQEIQDKREYESNIDME